MTMSRISTDWTVIPQGVVRSSMICCRSLSIFDRPTRISASESTPITSRSAVCAAQEIAVRKSSTSMAAFSASQTSQKRTASTSTGTVSLVSVFSALNGATMTRVVDPLGHRVDDRNDPEQPGPFQTVKFAKPQDNAFFPLAGDLEGKQDGEGDE
jgi:hypothetical protein